MNTPHRSSRAPHRSGGSSTTRFSSHSPRPARSALGASRGGSFSGPRRPSSNFNRRGAPAKRDDEATLSMKKLFVNKAVQKSEETYTPVHTFADFAIPEKLKENLIHKGFIAPSPIQDQAIPIGLQARMSLVLRQPVPEKPQHFSFRSLRN